MELVSTNLGIISSYYYIKIETIGNFVGKIQANSNLKLKEILQMVCEAEELADYAGYNYSNSSSSEYKIIAQILTQIGESTGNNKVYALLMIYLNRLPATQEILHEVKKILPIVVKLCHALVDIISSFGYLKPLILTMQLSQMLVQAIYIGDSKLLQVMDKELCEKILRSEKYSKTIKDVNDFLNMEEEDRGDLLKGRNNAEVEKIASACNRYPSITVQCNLLDDEQAEEEEEGDEK